MQKPSEFIHAYLHALTKNEVKRLLLLLQADDKISEVKLMKAILSETKYNEPLLIKKTGYTKKSYQKIKSDLKSYLLSTSGYQVRVVNQIVIERISIAQGLLKRGFIEEGNRQLEELIKQAIAGGSGLYAAIALGLKLWSVVFNQRTRFNSIFPMLLELEGIIGDELSTLPVMTFSMRINDIMIHDPGLRKNDNRTTIENLASNEFLTKKHQSATVFGQYMMLTAISCYRTLVCDFKHAIDTFIPVLKKRYGQPPYTASQEIANIYEQQCQNALLSHNASLINTHVNLFCQYGRTWFPKDTSILTAISLFQCWKFIQEKNMTEADNEFHTFITHFSKSFESLAERSRYSYLYRAMLLSLNLSKSCRASLHSFVATNHFDFEWNESYSTTYRLFELFVLFDEAVVIKKGSLQVNNEALSLQAKRTKDLFRKKNIGEYAFEIQLSTFMSNLRSDTTPLKFSRILKRYIAKGLSADLLEKPYVKYYFAYFNFKEWTNSLLIK